MPYASERGEGVVKLAIKVKYSVDFGFGYGFPVLHYD
jgi:hypothetical protein